MTKAAVMYTFNPTVTTCANIPDLNLLPLSPSVAVLNNVSAASCAMISS